MDDIAKAENAIKEILVDLELKTGRVVDSIFIREDVFSKLGRPPLKLKSVAISLREKPGQWA